MGKCGLESPVMGTKASGDDIVVQKGIDNVAYEQTDTHYGDESSCRYIQGEFSLDGENKPDVRKDSPHREKGTGQDGKAADENEGQKVKYTWQVSPFNPAFLTCNTCDI